MKIGLAQLNSRHNKPANLAAAGEAIARLAAQAADLVLLPEMFNFHGLDEANAVAAEEIPGPSSEWARDRAREYGIFVHCGSLIELRKGKRYNTSLVFDRAGAEIARYSKMHLFDVKLPDGLEYSESAAITPGDDVVVCDCDGVSAGLAICYDLRFPQLFHALVDRGAEVFLLPAAFTVPTGISHWEPLLRARAIENGCYVAACGQWGALRPRPGELRPQHGRGPVGDGRRSMSRTRGHPRGRSRHGASARGARAHARAAPPPARSVRVSAAPQRSDPRTPRLALAVLNPRRLYHRAELEFADRLPASGPAVIVSNHGRLDFDCFILMSLLLRDRSRPVRLLADHLWFKLPGIRRLWWLAGAVDGTRDNANALLANGELVLTYPGGVREIMGSRFGRESIDWDGRQGFARIAIEAGAPVIPILGLGVNSGHVFLTSGRRLGKLLFQRVLKLGAAYDNYRDPLTDRVRQAMERLLEEYGSSRLWARSLDVAEREKRSERSG